MEPAPMELGTANSTIYLGETAKFFVPYSIVNEQIVNATMTMVDDATGEVVGTYDMLPSTDESAALLSLPEGMSADQPFYFVSFTAGNEYFGKTISLHSKVTGQSSKSNVSLAAAFQVMD
jgi:hypothetical protein